ncbi:hypothetical protein ACWEPR_38880, partial [Streptomyces sp. NPDC004290]
MSDSLTCVSTPPLADLPIRRLTPRDLVACADLSEDRGWPREQGAGLLVGVPVAAVRGHHGHGD